MIKDTLGYKTTWKITKYNSPQSRLEDDPYEISVIRGNVALNEGITEMLNLLVGETATDFGNSNAYIGVGDSNTATNASQEGLQSSSNKAYIGMEVGYPSVSEQSVTWQAEFGSGDGNFDWEEFTVANGNSDSADNLNRAISSQGTKIVGMVWLAQLTITWS